MEPVAQLCEKATRLCWVQFQTKIFSVWAPKACTLVLLAGIW